MNRTAGTPPATPDYPLGQGSLSPMMEGWWSDLVWPRVLGAARLGLRPSRLGLAFFGVIIAALLLEIGRALDALLVKSGPAWPWATDGARPDEALSLLWTIFVETPLAAVLGRPVTVLLIGPVLLTVGVLVTGAISRMVAAESARDEIVGWTDGLRFAIQRWRSLLGAVLSPLILAWGTAALMTLVGVLARWPVVNILAALVYGLALLASFFTVLILVVYTLGRGMLIPAVVCEGTDAIDAIQKAYRYVLARPVRVVAYLLAGLIGWLIVVGVVWLLVFWTIGFAARATAAGTGGWATQAFWSIWQPTIDGAAGLGHAGDRGVPLQGTHAFTAALIRLWVAIPVVLFWAAVVSCWVAVCTLLYLGMRRVCDGQDMADLWTPEMIPGTMAVSLEGRAKAAAEAGFTPPAAGAGLEEADYQ